MIFFLSSIFFFFDVRTSGCLPLLSVTDPAVVDASVVFEVRAMIVFRVVPVDEAL